MFGWCFGAKRDPGHDKQLSWEDRAFPNGSGIQTTQPRMVFFKHAILLQDLRLHTVCEKCKMPPNHWECWAKGTATFMIAGDHCTRACKFCAVSTAKPLPLENDEPIRVAEATRRMKLKHVVITAVARDDLADGGAAHFRETV